MMPGLGGFDLLRELRSAQETQELPVIMLSARAGQEASIQGLEAGADDYLPKPCSSRELLARVRSHLELSLVRRQASRQIREEQLLLEQTIRQLPAGVTALARHSTWTHARLHPDPDWVLCSVSDALLARGYGRYCTAVYGRIELTETGAEVTLAAGGHPPPLLRRTGGTVERITDHGPLLGVFSDPAFPVRRVTLEPGDALVLYTDGLIERNPRVPGEDELAGLVAELPAADAPRMLAALQDAALGPAPRRPRDDVAILIVQIPR